MIALNHAFAVDDDQFDAIHARIKEAGVSFSADPDSYGHNLELLTRP